MSKNIISLLDVAVSNGSLLSQIKISKSISDIVVWLGYSIKGTTIAVIRDYLEKVYPEYLEYFNANKNIHLEEKECPVCKKMFSVSKTNKKDSKKITCGYSCSNKYFRSGKDHPNWKGGKNYREKAIEAYGEICQICGYNNPLAIVVHHIDHDRSNNELDNLIVLCANCHLIAHSGNYNK